MDTAKEGAEAAGEKEVHEEKAPLVADEREFNFGTGDGGTPWVFLDVVQGEGAGFFSAEEANRRAEQDTERTGADQEKSAEVTDWRTTEPHALEVKRVDSKRECEFGSFFALAGSRRFSYGKAMFQRRLKVRQIR